jgi:hypothetical protein
MKLIDKHKISIQCSNKDVAKSLRDELSDILDLKFYPELDKLLNKYDQNDRIWIIDNLEVIIDHVAEKNWRETIVVESLNQIEKYLKVYCPKSCLSKDTFNEETVNSLFQNNKYAQKLIYTFLQKGFVPTNALSNRIEELFELIEVDEHFIREVEYVIKEFPNSVLRWTLNVPRHIKFEFLGIKKVAHDLNFVQGSSGRFTKLNEFLEYLYWLAVFKGEKLNFQEPYLFKIKSVAYHYFEIDSAYVDNLLYQVKEKKFEELDLEFDASVKLSEDEDLEFVNQPGKNLTESIFIQNSGLILLHPFLPKLFTRLDYLENNKWKNLWSQHRACLLLQFITSFNEEIFENDLTLNKILCGIGLEDVVSTKVEFTQKEKAACNDLLLVVIDHWEILGKTSVNGLQESFISRPGKIFQNGNESFELKVEGRSYDMLLDQLPWGISMVKVSWMDQFLICYWN